jgi:type II secretory pathway pseudopilin PulG
MDERSRSLMRYDRGFSIVELIVVMAILMVVLAIAVPIFNSYRDRANLQEAAQETASDIKLYLQRAVAENREYRITFDAGANQYVIQNQVGASWVDVATKQIGAGHRSVSIFETPAFGGNTTVNMKPRGTLASGGHLKLKHAQSGKVVRITATLMGRVYVKDE